MAAGIHAHVNGAYVPSRSTSMKPGYIWLAPVKDG
jgi:hypothetical protein